MSSWLERLRGGLSRTTDRLNENLGQLALTIVLLLPYERSRAVSISIGLGTERLSVMIIKLCL